MRGVENIPWLYDLLVAVPDHRWLGRWRRWLIAGARGRVLEIGCGTGRNLPLYPPGVVPVAVEPQPQNLAAAQRRGAALFVQARAEALPFRDGAFDTVASSLVLCSVEAPSAALAEIRRVLGPGGALRAIEHVRAPGWAARVQDAVQPAWTWLSGGCRPNRDTEAAVAAAGFRVEPESRRAHGVMRRFVASR